MSPESPKTTERSAFAVRLMTTTVILTDEAVVIAGKHPWDDDLDASEQNIEVVGKNNYRMCKQLEGFSVASTQEHLLGKVVPPSRSWILPPNRSVMFAGASAVSLCIAYVSAHFLRWRYSRNAYQVTLWV